LRESRSEINNQVPVRRERGFCVSFSSLFFLPFPLSLFLFISLSFSISFYISFSCFGSFFYSFIPLAFSLSFPHSVSLSFPLLHPSWLLSACGNHEA
jgi:hypothetical protein